MASDITKQHKRKLWFWRILDAVLLLSPIFYGVINGLAADGLVAEKATLIGCVTIALILVFLNIIAKWHLRSPIWIILIGCYVAMGNILGLIIWIAIATVLDELLLTPIIKYEKEKTIVNATIDEREAEE